MVRSRRAAAAKDAHSPPVTSKSKKFKRSKKVLSKSRKNALRNKLLSTPGTQVLSVFTVYDFQITLTVEDLEDLSGPNFISDAVINAFNLGVIPQVLHPFQSKVLCLPSEFF